MEELISRLEKATGPDRDIDHAIARVCPRFDRDRPFYTASIDAALMLVPEWHKWSVSCGRLVQYVARMTPVKAPHGCFDGECDSTPAIALCIAALKARREQTPKTAFVETFVENS